MVGPYMPLVPFIHFGASVLPIAFLKLIPRRVFWGFLEHKGQSAPMIFAVVNGLFALAAD